MQRDRCRGMLRGEKGLFDIKSETGDE